MYMVPAVEDYLAHFQEVVETGAIPDENGEPVKQWYCYDRDFVVSLDLQIRKQLAACALAGSQPTMSISDALEFFEQRNPETILLSIPRYQMSEGLEKAAVEIPEWFVEPPPEPEQPELEPAPARELEDPPSDLDLHLPEPSEGAVPFADLFSSVDEEN